MKVPYSRGNWWEGIRTGSALVLANKHINNKVDNQVGREGAEGQPLVLKEHFGGSSYGECKVLAGLAGEG